MHLHAFHSGGFVHAIKHILPPLTLRQTLTDGRERVPQAGRSRILRSASYRCLSDPDADSLCRYFQKAENFDTHRVNVAKKDFEGRGQHGPVPLGQTATVAVSCDTLSRVFIYQFRFRRYKIWWKMLSRR